MKTIGKIRGVYAGKAVPFTRPGTFSAIDKQPVAGPVAVGTEGLQCDEQGDRRVHGGPDKAVHVYAWPNMRTGARSFRTTGALMLRRRLVKT